MRLPGSRRRRTGSLQRVPVLVTGAETGPGRAAVTALLRRGGEVRAWLDAEVVTSDDVRAFAAMGCKPASGEILDEGRLEAALEQVHTVVHLWGGPLVEPDVEVDAAAAVLSGALSAGCRRMVWASHLGVETPSEDPYLDACVAVEELLDDATLESVVLRRGLCYGRDDALTRSLAASAGTVPADPVHAPLWLGDLGAAVAEADALRTASGREDLHVVVSLAGPDLLPLGAIAGGLGFPPGGTPRLPAGVLALYAHPVEVPPDALGRAGTTFAEGVRLLRG